MRHALGDTNAAAPLRPDSTYLGLLALYDEPTATTMLARSLANQFGQRATNVSIPGGPSIAFGDRVRSWLATADAIDKSTATGGSTSGTSQEIRIERFTTDQSEYRRGWDDLPVGYDG